MKRLLLTVLTVCLGCLGTLPLQASEVMTMKRPTVGLVLSGGGARGFAHVGVIKVLEELGIPIDIVVGTSMGAMVGGGYASGMTTTQMQDIILGVDWEEMFALRPDRNELNWRQRNDDYKNLFIGEIGITPEGPKMPSSLVPAQHLGVFLSRITEHVADVNDLSNLAIPFAAVATDLGDGATVVMQKKTSLATAMRASMSIPGAFAPVRFQGRSLVDGGLAQNLPVETAKALGADVVIAVNVGTPLAKPENFNSVVSVMTQMVGILTERNVDQSKSMLSENDVLITPDLGSLSAADFQSAKAIIDAGERSARNFIPQLKRLAVSQQTFERWNLARTLSTQPPLPQHLAEVRVEGLSIVNPKVVEKAADLTPGQLLTQEAAAHASGRIWALNNFTTVPYEMEPGPGGTQVLVFRPQEKPWGYNTFRLGGKVSTDFQDEHSFQVVMNHTMEWLNRWGGEWRNDLRIGKDGYLSTSLYQPLGAGSSLFIQPEISYENQDYEWYRGRDYPDSHIHNQIFESQVSLGLELGNYGLIRTGLGWASIKAKPTEGMQLLESEQRIRSAFGKVALELDTLDSVAFPTSGFALHAQGIHFLETFNGQSDATDYAVDVTLPLQWSGDFVTVFSGKVGQSSIPGRYALGGLFNLSGSAYGRYSGSDMVLGRVIGYKRLPTKGYFGFPIYVGGSIEVGRLQERSGLNFSLESSDVDRWIKAGSVFVAANSLFGPVYLALGRTSRDDTSLYFYWGVPY